MQPPQARRCLSRPPNVRAATYDTIIKGGRVVDPSLRLNALRDVAISEGRIAAIDPNIADDVADTIDARGRLVVPGLIDIHTHYARDEEGPRICLADGVTGWIDAGSQGADHIDDLVAVAESAPQQGRLLINIGRSGILPDGDTMDLSLADVGAATDAIARHRDVIIGVKARLTRNVAADDFEVLSRAQEVASSFDLPVMIHMGQTVSPLPRLLNLLKRGDIVTHMFAPPPNSIIDDDGHMLPAVLAAPATRRLVRCRQRTDRPSEVGHLRPRLAGGLLARHVFHRRQPHEWDHRGGDQLPEYHVEVPQFRDDDRPGRGALDGQCLTRLPAVQRPRDAQCRRPGRHRDSRAQTGHVRVRR